MNDLFETIAAIATPPGAGGIGIIRVSGKDAFAVAGRVFRANSGDSLDSLPGFTARLGKARDADGALLDEAICLVFHAPKSYTGEDVAEIMCHGGELVCDAVLRAVCDAGAVMADRGEFTRRAYLNGRLSLTQAEAVCDVINAASRQGERAAASLVGGALARKLDEMKGEIQSLQAQITACIDFPEEDVDEMDAGELFTRLNALVAELAALKGSFTLGADLIRGIPAAIVGSPNVGKSTLLNLLAGAPKALVTPIAGTTRDVLEQRVRLGGATLLLADTAGIRESDDEIERLGIELALRRANEASFIFAVFDSSRPLCADDYRLIERLHNRRVLAVVNKTDLAPAFEAAEIERAFPEIVFVSANDPSSLRELDSATARVLKTEALDPNAPLLATERQYRCAHLALEAAQEAANASAHTTLDVVYALLSEAHSSLCEMSGENAAESVLDEVFSRFCVGK
ncbi:MAG: tRNA uridine-5-carboxymethylaminomethyl(34) synthesis GTPase MnmE [Oscillospiraceae bacterium]